MLQVYFITDRQNQNLELYPVVLDPLQAVVP